MTLAHAANPGRHRLTERRDDLYETPPEAVRALLAVEEIPSGAIWEPACGPGAIVRVLRAAGHEVYATDLVDYDSPDQDAHGIDFLMEHGSAPYYIGSIITNPPFKLADQFVRHALLLCPRVYMLLRLAFLESERRSATLESGWLKRVHVFRERLPMMHRAGWQGPRASSSMAFAWFVFDRRHRGLTELRRISWRRTATCLFDQGADREAFAQGAPENSDRRKCHGTR
jgi:hypothetical protein